MTPDRAAPVTVLMDPLPEQRERRRERNRKAARRYRRRRREARARTVARQTERYRTDQAYRERRKVQERKYWARMTPEQCLVRKALARAGTNAASAPGTLATPRHSGRRSPTLTLGSVCPLPCRSSLADSKS